MPTPPPRVLRFYSNIEYALECFETKQITFIHTSKLNDPFDPNFQFITDFNESYYTLLKIVQKKHKTEYDQFKQRLPEHKFASYLTGIKDQLKNFLDKAFVFSTCGVYEESEEQPPKNNLYMWGHYANGHRGVAIEFDSNSLSESLIRSAPTRNTTTTNKDIWWQIEYEDKIPKISCEDIIDEYFKTISLRSMGNKIKPENNLERSCKTKSKVWEKENEWRLIQGSDDENKIK